MTTHIPPAPVAADGRHRISTTISPRTWQALTALSRAWDDLPLGRVLDRLLTEEKAAQEISDSGTP